jgi:peptide/nickel transport system substrate-binding protein
VNAKLLRKPSPGETPTELRSRLRRLEGATLGHAHKFIVRRWKNLQEVRRMAGAWLLVVAALIVAAIWQTSQFSALYSADIPDEDTTYTEGVVGAVDNLNPIFASTPAEKAVSRLVFASLFSEDTRSTPQPELVDHFTLDGAGKVYTMVLRNDVRWQDGVPLTAKDVAYTFSVIKDADAHSQLYSSWRNITVEQVDDYTVKFTLPGPYTPFLNALTVGILPEHMLGKVRPSELRSHSFSRSPTVGSGPFIFRDVRTLGDSKNGQSIVRMDRNDDYFLGSPKLSHFQLHAYSGRDDLVNAFRTQEVAAISDESNAQLEDLNSQKNAVRTDSPLYNAVYAFLQMDSPLLKDPKVRNALELATDQPALLKQLHNRVQPVTGPLLSGQLGYDPALHQASTNLDEAKKLLDDAGWKLGPDGKRVNKDGQQLKLQLVTLSSGDFPAMAQTLMNQWARVGVTFDSQLVKPDDIQQNVIIPRAYDVLLYELAIGGDPDVYAYWHSSQATDRGFNLSEYKSAQADDALDSARSRSDPALRIAKYRTFTQKWLADVPAIGLYRPGLTYIQTKGVTSFNARNLGDPVDRYENVRFWSASKIRLRPTL